MQTSLEQRINAVLRFPEMSEDIVQALGSASEEEFERLMQRVEGRFESSPKYDVLCRVVNDYSKVRDDELLVLFEFIYSSLINNFKGELAELFARPRMRDFAATIGREDAESVWGFDIQERGVRNDRWLKGADGLLCLRSGSRLQIVAVIEIKAMQCPLPPVIAQVERHVARMRRGGVRIDGEEIPASAIDVAFANETRPLLDCAPSEVPALIARPWISSEDGAILPHDSRANLWVAELRYTQDEITEAAYRFTDWFFARMGPKLFHLPGEEPLGRKPAPHPEDTLEENGRNAFIAALYGVWQRDVFKPRPADAPRGGRRSPGDTFLWLYNSLCAGYGPADTTDIFFPPFEPDPAGEARRQSYMDATTAFVRGEFSEALAHMPDPAQQSDVWWRRREWLMLARIRAANGDFVAARDALSAARGEPASQNLAVPLEISAATALVDALEGRSSDALAVALDLFESIRTEIRLHETERWAFPADIDRSALKTASVDVAWSIWQWSSNAAESRNGLRGSPA